MKKPTVVSGTPPRWAVELAVRASRAFSSAPPDEISWRWTRYTKSSGSYVRERKRIHISAGADRRDQRYLVLHETAHHILRQAGGDRSRCHGPDYWSVCLELCRKFRVPVRYVGKRHTSRTLKKMLA